MKPLNYFNIANHSSSDVTKSYLVPVFDDINPMIRMQRITIANN